MSVLARIFLIVYSLLLAAAAIGLAVLAWNQDRMLDINAGDFTLRAFIDSGGAEKWIFTILAALVVAIAIISLIVALRPWRGRARAGGRSEEPVTLQQAGGGTIEVTPRAVEAMLVDELLGIDGVRQADAEVHMAKKSLDTNVALGVGSGVNFADVSREAAAVVTGTLRGRLNVTNVNPPNVRIEHSEGAPQSPPRAQYTAAPPPPAYAGASDNDNAGDYDDYNGNGDASSEQPAAPSPEPLPPPPPPRVTGVEGGVISTGVSEPPPPPGPGPVTSSQWKPNAPAPESDIEPAGGDRTRDSPAWQPAPPPESTAEPQPDARRDEGNA
jgi:hypothetical protein